MAYDKTASHPSRLGQSCPVSQCSFDYLSRSDLYKTEKPYYFSGPLQPSQESSRTNLQYTRHENIDIRDIRGLESQLTLEKDGFVLLHHEPTIELDQPTDEQIHAYLDEVTAFIKKELSAEAVVCYNYRYRRHTENPLTSENGGPDGSENVGTSRNPDQPVLVPHTDLTETAGPRRLQRHLNKAELRKWCDGNRRIRIMNCWRPLSRTADARPLAMCDYYSVNKEDLRRADRASREYVGEIYYLHYNSGQKWYWISHQLPEEMLLFLNYDSDPGESPPYMVHSSFVNNQAGMDAKSRESLEVSLIVVDRK